MLELLWPSWPHEVNPHILRVQFFIFLFWKVNEQDILKSLAKRHNKVHTDYTNRANQQAREKRRKTHPFNMNLMNLHFLYCTSNVCEKIKCIRYMENTRYHDQSHKPTKLYTRNNDQSHVPALKFSHILHGIGKGGFMYLEGSAHLWLLIEVHLI